MANPSTMALFFVLLFWSCLADAQAQHPLSPTSHSDPSSTDSIKSIFSSFSGRGSLEYTLESPTGCCNPSCALGFCNGFTLPVTTDAGTSSSTPAAPRITDFPRHPGRPGPDFGSDCSGRPPSVSLCTCIGVCNIVMRTSFVTEFPTATTHHSAPTVTAAASGAGSSSVPATGEYDLVQAFHANDFSGANQDTLPIIVQDHSGNPVSLIADINLDVADNYISQALVAKLGLASSTVSLSSQKQQVVTLGEANDTFSVTPHATISLNLLAGPAAALKKFGDVEFRVFDLPTPKAKGDGISWEPELFLGVRFLRAVGALGLTADFAGNGVVDGVPVLVRDLAFVNSQGRDVDVNGRVLGAEEDRKDEL